MWDIHPDMFTHTLTGVVSIMEQDTITDPGMGHITIQGQLPMAIMFTGIPIQDGDFHLGHPMAG